MQIISENYLTGSLTNNVAVLMSPSITLWMYMRPNLIIIAWATYDGPAVVLGVDPTSGKYWTQPFGMYQAYLLQQRGSSQVLVGSCGALILADV